MLRSVRGIRGVSRGEEKEGYGLTEKEGFKPRVRG